MNARLATLLLLLVAPAAVVRAEETVGAGPGTVAAIEPHASDPIGTWATGLGSPASRDPLAGLPAPPKALASDDAQRVVVTLAVAGGCEATEGILPFLDHRCPRVRAAAVRAVGQVGVRTREAADDVREASRDRDRDVRLAALDALGRVGDGRDVPSLLDALGSPDVEVRATAVRSLRTLTDVRLDGSTPRWDRWWRLASTSAPKRLYDALAAMNEAAAADALATARDTVVNYGWADLDAVEQAARGWLRSNDPCLRAEGARVAGALRLGELADDVRSVLRYTSDPELFAIAREAAVAIGVCLAGIRPPTSSPR